MRIKRKDLNLIIERYLLEQDDEAFEEEEDFEEETAEPETDEPETVEDDDTGDEAEDPQVADEGINIKIDFTLPRSSTKAKVNIDDGTVQVVFEKPDGTVIDLNKKLSINPTAKKEVEQDIIGTMMAATEKIKNPESIKKIRSTLIKMIGKADEKELDTDRHLATMKKNVIAKYGEN